MIRFIQLLILVWLSHLGAEHTPLLFVLYDAGETHALAPVMESLDGDGADFRILVMGTARDEIKHFNLPVSKILDLNSDLGVSEKVDRIYWQREQPLNSNDFEQLNKQISADVIVTGVVSVVQQQITNALKLKGSEILAYNDALTFTLDRHPTRAVVAPFQTIADVLMVASEEVADSFNCPVVVVGQPSLAVWAEKLASLDGEAVRHAYGFSNDPLIVYCGGYWGCYAEAFTLFVESLKDLKGWQVAVQLHPKVDGELEQSILHKAHASGVRVFKNNPGTLPLVAAADVVVCHQSTIGMQALLAGKKVIHVDLPDTGFSHAGIENGLCLLVTDPKAFPAALMCTYHAPVGEPADLYRKAGIPQNAKERVLQVINSSTIRADRPEPCFHPDQQP